MGDKILGASKWPSILGFLIASLIIAQETMNEGGVPDTPQGWINYGLAVLFAILGRITKQSNVSHSVIPTEPRPVSEPAILPPQKEEI